MASTFTAALGLEKQATGEGSNTWGDTLNDDVIDLIDTAIAARLALSVAGSGDATLTAAQALHAYHEYTGTLTGNISVIVPTSDKIYFIFNNTSGAFTLTVKTATGTGITVTQGDVAILYCDGTDVISIMVFGDNVQAYDAELAAIAGLTSAADKLPYFTGSGAAALANLPSFGRTLIANTTAALARTDLGLGTAAIVNTGLANGNVPTMDATGYRAADGSQITNLSEIPDASKAPGEMSNGTDAAKDIDFAATYCRAENGAVKITSTAMTKQIDASWVAGTNQGGLSSSLHPLAAAITTLHGFDIVVGGVADFGFDTDINAANLIADHSVTYYRRRGSLKTDATPDLPAFIQYGNKFILTNRVRNVYTTSPGTSENLVEMAVPLGLVVEVLMAATYHSNSTSYMLITGPAEANVAASATSHDFYNNTASSVISNSNLSRFSDELGRVRYRGSDGTIDRFWLFTLGWIDPRGRNS